MDRIGKLGKGIIMNGVYCLTSPSGKRYVGVAVRINGYGIEHRWGSYRKLNCKKQRYLYSALKKYGPENFKFEIILQTDDKERALRVEQQLIALWNLQNREYGYNLSSGGEHPIFSEETRKNL
jgi:group I intron endonuclease